MSRARARSHVYVAADDLDQPVDDLRAAWSADRRQRWVLDVAEVAIDDATRRPSLAPCTEMMLRSARPRAERAAGEAGAPAGGERGSERRGGGKGGVYAGR